MTELDSYKVMLKGCEDALDELHAENAKLREALSLIADRKGLSGEKWQSDAERMRVTAKEALK